MNHVYRSIWNDSTGTFVATSEVAKSSGKKASSINASSSEKNSSGSRKSTHKGNFCRSFKAAATALLMLFGTNLYALPSGGEVVSGTVTIKNDQSGLLITQGSTNAVVNWQSFNIDKSESVKFVQPSASSVSLNRVLGSDPSNIFGSLLANGKVILINPNGILFGQNASVNVGSLIASTRDMSNADFMNGIYKFAGSSNASVINQGNISTNNDGGYVALLGASVQNHGTISANLGTVALAAGDAMRLDMAGDGLLNIIIDTGAVNAVVNNTGTIQADGGKVFLTTQAATGLLNTVVNNTGLIQAQTLENHKGRIVLLGDMKNGTVHVGGTLDASAPNGGDGGFIETSAARVKISNNASITTKAANGKTGEWLIDPVDFTIAASDGDITGDYLSGQLDSTDVSIASNTDANGIRGNLNVNQAVSWNKNKLTLTANDVNINAVMKATDVASLELNPAGKVNVALGASGFTGSVDFASAGTLTIKGIEQTVITDQAGLQRMSLDLAGHYVLGDNINLAGSPFNPIGDSVNTFKGSLDGLGHTVNDLNINTPTMDYVGLFSYVNNQGDIRNIGIVNANITGASYVGAIAGLSYASIANSYSSGTVNGGTIGGGTNVGGLIGFSSASAQINNSYSSVNVSGVNNVGGLAGLNLASINKSYATGSVTGESNVGGLIGQTTSQSSINNSYATGSVDGSSINTFSGGLIGYNRGAVNNSYATGFTTGTYYVGGLVGGNYASINTNYATGSVKGVSSVGGLIGFNELNMNIVNSYATGSVDGYGSNTNTYSGGLIGYNRGTVNNSYATGSTTGINYVGGLVGVTYGSISKSYATGSVRGVSSLGGLIGYSNSNTDNNYATGSVDINSNSNIINNNTFSGGLIGYNNSGTVSNSYATGSARGVNYVGGLVGLTTGVISTSYATGAVNGVSYVGGLIGYSGLNVNNSYATGSVVGENNSSSIGGLIGRNAGIVNSSYASGYTSGVSFVGGLIGSNQSSSVTNNYWKINEVNLVQQGIGVSTTVIPTSGATGLTAAQMTDEFKFTSFNFTQTIWGFATGVNNDQPILCEVSTCSVTVYVNPTAGTNVYGTAPVFAYTLVDRNGASYSLNNASLDGTATNTSTAPTKFSDVDKYTFRYASGYGLSGTDASTYVLKAWKTPTNWTVTPAYLTITPDNLSRLYGEVNPDLTYKVSGFVNGESLSTPGIGSPSLTTTAMPTTSVGDVNIDVFVNNLGTRNYITSGLNGTLTINKAHLTVTADNQLRLYGQADPILTTTVSGFVNSDDAASATSGTGRAETLASSTTNVGDVKITAGIGTLTATNYDFTKFVDGTLTINKALLTVTADNQSRLYGQANPSLTTTVTGFVNSENAASATSGTGSAETLASSTTNVGDVKITAGIGTLTATNYDFTNFVDGTLSIGKAHLTVTAGDKSRLYGQINPIFTTKFTGFVNGETAATAANFFGAGIGLSTATKASNVGTADITPYAFLTAKNYDLTNFVKGTLTINPAPLLVTADNKTRFYGAVNPTFTQTITGFVLDQNLATSGVTGTAYGSSTATTTTLPGTAVITGSLGTLVSTNYYFLTPVNGVLTIKAKK